MAIVGFAYLERTFTTTDKQVAVKSLVDEFKSCTHLKEDLNDAFDFWDQLVASVRVLGKQGAVPDRLMEQFEATHAWLNQRRP
jgi:hypothetical protein